MSSQKIEMKCKKLQCQLALKININKETNNKDPNTSFKQQIKSI
jgi:hypothetical protein